MYRDNKKEFRLFLDPAAVQKRQEIIQLSGLRAYAVDEAIYLEGLKHAGDIRKLVHWKEAVSERDQSVFGAGSKKRGR